jgi:MFS family permease
MQKKTLRWYDHIAINTYWLGINVASGTITPVLLPYLVALFAPPESKNTYLASIRVIGLAVAMMIQPVSGMLSDRSTHPLGRRRPFIIGGTLFNALFLLIVGSSVLFMDSPLDEKLLALLGVTLAYLVLLAGIALLQISSNVAQGALQGLIPDIVPDDQRGRASGVKAVMELLPAFLVIGMGPLVDAGRTWQVIAIIIGTFLVTMLITVICVREKPLKEKPTDGLREPVLRILALTTIFVAVTRGSVAIVRTAGSQLSQRGAGLAVQIAVVGLAGLVSMAGSIFVGVYIGAWVGIGKGARKHTAFIWWIVNRLLYLAAVGSIQGFAQYYLSDVLHIPNAATMTTLLLAAVAVFLIASALGGGYLADRVGHRRLVALSGLIAAAGTFLLLFAPSVPLVLVSGCIIGTATGTFMATNWALGTRLAPPEKAGLYLGISNLAGAGAGIVGAGIGGPMADFFNALSPGLGYLVIFAAYGVLFLFSVLALTQVKDASTP